MKIFTNTFKENQALISYCSTNNSEISEGLYFDFQNKKVSLKNTYRSIFIQFDLNYEEEEEKEYKNFLVNADLFLSIISSNDFIYYDGKKFFYEKNEYNLRTNSSIVYPSDIDDEEYENSFEITPKVMALLNKSANIFFPEKAEHKFNTSYIDKGCIYSINNYRGYLVKDDSLDENVKIDFHKDTIDILKCLSSKSIMFLYSEDEKSKKRKIVTDTGTSIIFPCQRFPIPDFSSKIFDCATRDEKVVLNKEDYVKTLNSLKSMYSSIDYDKNVAISINEDEMIFEVKDNINPYIKLVIPIIEKTNITSDVKTLNYENLIKVSKLIDGETIELKIIDNLPILILKSTLENVFEISISNIPKIIK